MATPLRRPALASPPVPDAATVLTKAVVRTGVLLELSQAQLARALGMSAPTASRLCAGQWQLAPNSKPWELATLLIRVFRSLDAITGGQAEARRAWLTSHNEALAAPPISLLTQTEGLVNVLRYLDAARACN